MEHPGHLAAHERPGLGIAFVMGDFVDKDLILETLREIILGLWVQKLQFGLDYTA